MSEKKNKVITGSVLVGISLIMWSIGFFSGPGLGGVAGAIAAVLISLPFILWDIGFLFSALLYTQIG